jgi:hypothetical protein
MDTEAFEASSIMELFSRTSLLFSSKFEIFSLLPISLFLSVRFTVRVCLNQGKKRKKDNEGFKLKKGESNGRKDGRVKRAKPGDSVDLKAKGVGSKEKLEDI